MNNTREFILNKKVFTIQTFFFQLQLVEHREERVYWESSLRIQRDWIAVERNKLDSENI